MLCVCVRGWTAVLVTYTQRGAAGISQCRTVYCACEHKIIATNLYVLYYCTHIHTRQSAAGTHFIYIHTSMHIPISVHYAQHTLN